MKTRDVIIAVAVLCFWTIHLAFGLELGGMDWSVREASTGFAYFFTTFMATVLTVITVMGIKTFDDK